MVRNKTTRPQGQGEAGTEETGTRYHVERYGNTRNWALYDGGKLKAVVVYKKGGKSLQEELEARDAVIAEQAARIEQLTAALPAPPGPAAPRFQDRVWPEVQGQLGFFSKAEKERFTAGRRSPRGRT
jgi:hypothetical protein